MVRRSQGVHARLAIGVLLSGAVSWWAVGCQFPDYRLSVEPSGGSGGDAPEPDCTGAMLECAPAVPAGWRGPAAFWEGSEASPPDCPDGYSRPQDVLAELMAAPAECLCECQATGQSCPAARVSVFNDTACDSGCADADGATCAPITGCSGSVGSVRAPAVAPSGGSCTSTLDEVLPEPSWSRRARLCEAEAQVRQCVEGQACVAGPSPPYSSQVCVYRVALEDDPVPPCPTGYPRGPALFHTEFRDTRGCGECDCSGPLGGSCEAKVLLSPREDCSEAFEYEVGSGCSSYQLGDALTHLEASYVLTEGTCVAAGNAEALGDVEPSGNPWVVCCAD